METCEYNSQRKQTVEAMYAEMRSQFPQVHFNQ